MIPDERAKPVLVPTVMLSFVEIHGAMELHQLYVDALGNTEWRPVPTRSATDLQTGKTYEPCQSFGDDGNAGIPSD